jgi:molecular chaperone GrpE
MNNNEDLTKSNESGESSADESLNTAADKASEKAASAEPRSATEILEAKAKEAEQKYLYLYAEFENFKKRSFKERQDIVKFGWEGVASELLGVLDNLDRALQFTKPEANDPNLIQGLQMVAQQFKTALEKNGVAPIQCMDREFSPELHEAVIEENSTKPKGTILQEHQKGYTLHGRLLRPSRVAVSNGIANN